jgi:hypothetical protein
MNLFCDGAITPKKMETLHHALRAMVQFPVIFFRVMLHHQEKKIIP